MGARATTAKLNLDRFWRNVRTQTLHDPVDYKYQEVGEWILTGKVPDPSFILDMKIKSLRYWRLFILDEVIVSSKSA